VLLSNPPYLANKSSRLYGKKGNLHTEFDHERLARLTRECKHKWLISYDDCLEVRELYKDFAHIHEIELVYSMNNVKQRRKKEGKELVITNYPLDFPWGKGKKID